MGEKPSKSPRGGRPAAAPAPDSPPVSWTWAGLLVLLVVFAQQAYSHLWYNDDTFITFRYARNLAEGFGFVWNSAGGVPVEGSTSMGWMLLNALGIRFGLDPVVFSHALGVFSGAVSMVVAWWAAWKLLGLSPGRALVVPLLLTLQRQWILWAVSGLETRAATLLVLIATVQMVREQMRDKPGWWPSGVLFFVASVFRPEVPLLHLGAGVGLALARRCRRNLVAIVLSGCVHGALLALLMGWRMWIFGRPLPNTFYAKVGGVQLSLGLTYVGQFLLQNYAWLWLPVLLAGLWVGRSRLPPLVPAVVVQSLVWTGWIAVEGGGAWEFRFFDVLLPGIALTLAFALGVLLPAAARPVWRRWVFLGAALALTGALAAPTFLPFKTFFPTVSWRRLKRSADEMLREGRLLAPFLRPEDRICIGWAGAVPYVTGAWHLDPFGLNDPEIATRPFQSEGVLFHQRHAVWQDVVDRRVMFCDIYNQFLYEKPYGPNQVPKAPMPWARDGIMVHCLELPSHSRLRYWIFASPLPREQIKAWADQRGLRLIYSSPLILPRGGRMR